MKEEISSWIQNVNTCHYGLNRHFNRKCHLVKQRSGYKKHLLQNMDINNIRLIICMTVYLLYEILHKIYGPVEEACSQEMYQPSWPLDIIRKIKVARQWGAVHLQRMGNSMISSRITDFTLKGRQWGHQNFSGSMMKWKGSYN